MRWSDARESKKFGLRLLWPVTLDGGHVNGTSRPLHATPEKPNFATWHVCWGASTQNQQVIMTSSGKWDATVTRLTPALTSPCFLTLDRNNTASLKHQSTCTLGSGLGTASLVRPNKRKYTGKKSMGYRNSRTICGTSGLLLTQARRAMPGQCTGRSHDHGSNLQ